MLYNKKMTNHSILHTLILAALFFVYGSAQAQTWDSYSGENELFHVRMPTNLVEDNRELRLDHRIVAQAGQTTSTFDQRPFKNAVKNYIVKYEQTLGPPLTDDDITELLADELENYALHFSKMNGILKDRKHVIYQQGVPGGEIHISYDDPTIGEQSSIRSRIFFTDTGKFQHIVSGPEDMMNSFQTDKFFDSLILSNGYKRSTGSLRNSFAEHKSPLGIFTAYLPEPVAPYVPEAVNIRNSDGVERMSIRFYDPIFKDTIFYNIYGYVLDQALTYLNVENILKQKHVLRHRLSADNISFEKLTNKDVPVLETHYRISSPEGYPLIDRVKLRAMFYGNKVVVHEIMSSKRLAETQLMDSIVKSVVFHPQLERAKQGR